MSTLNRLTLIKVHMLLAAFVFPVALMFLITGSLYTWEYKGSYNTDVYTLTVAAPLTDDLDALSALVEAELARLDIDPPTGKAKLKRVGNSFMLEWTGSQRDIILEPTTEPLQARLKVKETTWYRTLVQLHKAKGGQLFKIYAAVLAISLFMILASGFIMAWQIPKYRNTAISAFIAGLAAFAFVVALS